jgi:hypothetical protein
VLIAAIATWTIVGAGRKTPSVSTLRPPKSTPARPSHVSRVVPEGPASLAVGPNGNLYIADDTRNQILERLANGRFIVVAGTGTAGMSGNGKLAVNARLDDPGGMAFGPDGTLYFADERNHRVRAVSPDGIISTVAGGGSAGRDGFVSNGTPALEASISPSDIAFGPDRHLYITTGNQVLLLESDGTLTEVVGGESPPQGLRDVAGPAADTSVDGVEGLAFDSTGDLYIFEFDIKTVLMVTPSGILTEPYGEENLYPHGDAGLVRTSDGSVIAMGEDSIVRLSPTGMQTIFSFPIGMNGSFDGVHGFLPNGIAVNSEGNILVDTAYGNGFTQKTAIAEIDPSNGKSTILWERGS